MAAQIEQVEAARVNEWLAAGEAAVIDVREPDEARRERIAGSTLLPLSRFDAAAARAEGDTGKRLVLVCKSGRRAADAAGRLAAAGGAPVVLTGGMDAWKRAGLPVEGDAKAPIAIMRQVQITAGGFVLIGTILGAVLSPWLLIIPGFFGAGLLFSGLSGTCGMAAMLAHMPWNRQRPASPVGGAHATP